MCESKCVLAASGQGNHGYAVTWHEGSMVLSHRVAYCLHRDIPLSEIKGMVIRHRCDTPLCVNPDHLEVGSHADNSRDMRERGRSCVGEGRWNSKLTEEAVRNMRAKRLGGAKLRDIAAEFGMGVPQVSDICSGKAWGHIT